MEESQKFKISGHSPSSMNDLWENMPCRIGAPVVDFSPERYTKMSKRMSRFTQFGYGASLEALSDAGLLKFNQQERDTFEMQLDQNGIEPERIGVCIGSGTTSLTEIAENYELLKITICQT